jgi:hypothetical protein
MDMKRFYILLCVIGLVLPYSQFLPWLFENGLVPVAFVQQAFSQQVSGFAWMDVIVSALVVFGFILAEGRQLGVQNLWAPLAGTFLVGVSFGLPLFLLLRELHTEKAKTSSA